MDYDEFEKRMTEQFPKMFSQPFGGFAIGPGWWPVIESLCRQIQHYIDWKEEQRIKYNRGDGCTQVVVTQIKEKFGGLRFYYDGGDNTIDGMVRMAEAWADNSCEECGAPGTRRSGGWIRTLCNEHERIHQEKLKQRLQTE